jgi:4-diphosphocytidyl-2-C-methyl-D-erythritol kinase
MTEIKLKAYAKINLFLDITGVLPNGYHSLNNVMQQIELHDDVKVSLSEGSGVEITCDNPAVPTDKRNIAYKAAALFTEKTGLSAKITVDIKKNIPVMAGLGGSSTDGAAVLKALNRLCGEPLTCSELEMLGAELSADVPFCIRGNAALCRGIGEKMTDIRGLENCYILIAKPDFSCGTSQGYKLYDKTPLKNMGEPGGLIAALKENDLKKTAKYLYNIFESLYHDSRIEKIKNDLLSSNALGALLSGSGSAVFGLFDDEEKALEALSHLNYPFTFLTKPFFSLEKK